MESIIIQTVDRFGYLGVFLLIMIENLFPPIPSEVILTLGGFMTTYTSMHIVGVVAASTAGSVAGAVILYCIGRVLTTERLDRLIGSRAGRVLRLKKADVRKAGRWFVRQGGKAVFLCRFVPIVRSLISIPAGMSKMKFSSFLLLTTAGTLIWNVALVLLGRAAGSAWETVAHYFDVYTMVVAVVLIAAAAIIGTVFIKKRFFPAHKAEQAELDAQAEYDAD